MISLLPQIRQWAERGVYKSMGEYKVIIPGRFPSLNEFVEANRIHKQKGNKMKQESQNLISLYLMQQHRKLHIDRPVTLHYSYYEPNKKRDLDNISGYFHKVFQDALVNYGILHNDSWYYITGFTDDFFIDNKNPRIEVIIQEVGK